MEQRFNVFPMAEPLILPQTAEAMSFSIRIREQDRKSKQYSIRFPVNPDDTD